MFFRRRLIEPGGYFFNPDYRCGGDQEWMVRLLRDGVKMAALGEFTSVFTRTGVNLGRDERAEVLRRDQQLVLSSYLGERSSET